MTIPKSVIIAELRNRGLNERADFVNRQLPDEVDPNKHGGLLGMLHLDIAELSRAGAAANPPAAT